MIGRRSIIAHFLMGLGFSNTTPSASFTLLSSSKCHLIAKQAPIPNTISLKAPAKYGNMLFIIYLHQIKYRFCGSIIKGSHLVRTQNQDFQRVQVYRSRQLPTTHFAIPVVIVTCFHTIIYDISAEITVSNWKCINPKKGYICNLLMIIKMLNKVMCQRKS